MACWRTHHSQTLKPRGKNKLYFLLNYLSTNFYNKKKLYQLNENVQLPSLLPPTFANTPWLSFCPVSSTLAKRPPCLQYWAICHRKVNAKTGVDNCILQAHYAQATFLLNSSFHLEVEESWTHGLDNAIHWINLCWVDNTIPFANTYLLVSSLSIIHPLYNLALVISNLNSGLSRVFISEFGEFFAYYQTFLARLSWSEQLLFRLGK